MVKYSEQIIREYIKYSSDVYNKINNTKTEIRILNISYLIGFIRIDYDYNNPFLYHIEDIIRYDSLDEYIAKQRGKKIKNILNG